MSRLAGLTVVVIYLTCAQAQEADICHSGQTDLRFVTYLEFTRTMTTCQNTTACEIRDATLQGANCNNRARGNPNLSWSCGAIFDGFGFTLISYHVTCPGYSSTQHCVSKAACRFEYTPAPLPQSAVIYSSIGSVLSFFIFVGIIYYCCCWRRRQVTTIIRTAPPPRPRTPPQPTVQTNVTVDMGAFAAFANPAPAGFAHPAHAGFAHPAHAGFAHPPHAGFAHPPHAGFAHPPHAGFVHSGQPAPPPY